MIINIFIKIEYNGTKFYGWQFQPDKITVQEKIETALKIIFKKKVDIVGSGRTDAGVHALGQCASFKIDDSEISNLDKFKKSLNALCGYDIIIHTLKKVSLDFHARYSALSRSYCYKISLKERAIDKDFWYIVRYKIDFSLMQEAARKLLGKHDFKNISSKHNKEKSTICNILELRLEKQKDEILMYITGDRFIRKMVRMIAGLLVDIGREKFVISYIDTLFESKENINKGVCAPANALTFLTADYKDEN